MIDTTTQPPADPALHLVPAGFTRLVVGGPYFRQLGPMYSRPTDAADATKGIVLGMRVIDSHLNTQSVCHGGMLTTVADGALGIAVALAVERRAAYVTVSLTADFLSSAKLGDWLEAHVQFTRRGKRLMYANCDLRVGSRHVLRSSAVFSLVDRPPPKPPAGDTLLGEAPLADG